MELVWISSPQSRRVSGVFALIIGILILLFSSLLTGLLGIFLSAVVLIVSIIILVVGYTMRNSGFSFPVIVLGILGPLMGLTALLSPELAVSALGIFLGLLMILLGAGHLFLASAFSADRLYYILLILGGILAVVVGIFLIFSPVEGVQVMVMFLGCYLIVYSILGLIRPQRTDQSQFRGM
jgi:uncharacterized membrane protein HdeD (DUF308 family)